MAAREAMSSVDHAWLRMDQPTNLMMITGVLAFAKPLDYERVCNLLAERQLRFDRFRQRVVPPDTPLRSPKWQVDPNFDIHYHLRRVSLPAPGGQEALQALVSDLMSRPLEPDRPLWQYHLVENYERGSALVARLHHCIADGIALMRVLLSLTNESAEAEWAPPEKEKRPRRPGALARTVAGTWRVTETAVQEGLEMLLDPARALQLAHTGSAAVTRLGRILVRWPDPKTVFKGELGVEKRAAWSRPLALSDVKAVGSVTGGTVNDVLLTAMAGALRKYIRGRGEPVDGLNFHAVVPINLRPLDGPIELGNKFGLVFLALPIGIAGQVERLEEVRRRMDKLKRSPEAVALFGLLNVVGKGPAALENVLLNVFGTKATGIMTNVPGPRQQLYLAGSPLRDIMFWVPQSGRLGLGVSIMSYNGGVSLGVATDAGLVPDPQAIIDRFHEEFIEMMELVTMVRQDSAATVPEPAAARRCQATTKAGHRCRNRARPGTRTCHVHGHAPGQKVPGQKVPGQKD